MTLRQDIQAALSRAGADQIPAVLCYEGIYVRDHWRQLTDAPWWYAQSFDLDQQLQWRRDVVARTGQDWFELPGFYTRRERATLTIEPCPDGVYRFDRRTGRALLLSEPQIGGWSGGARGEASVESINPDHLAESVDELDRLIPLMPEFNLAAVRDNGSDDLARASIAQHPDLYPLGYVASPLWLTYHVWGFEGMMRMIAARPDLVRHACDRMLTQSLHSIRQAAWLGAAGVWIEDCLTDMISPAAFAALNLPYLRRLTGEIRAAGMSSIYYFCGSPAGKWDLLLDAGADALALEESKKGFVIDVADTVARVNGRCAVLGNLDAIGVLQNGSEAQLRAEIARQIAAGRRNGGRFVMSIGSPVTPGTPVERVRLYCDFVHELGRQ
jgi:hypothetical protein